MTSEAWLTSILSEFKYFDSVRFDGKPQEFADYIIVSLDDCGYKIVEK